MKSVALNKKAPILTETLENGDVFVVGDKPRIEHKNGSVTGLCLDLRCWYDRSNGFIERKFRTDHEVIVLSKKWLTGIIDYKNRNIV